MEVIRGKEKKSAAAVAAHPPWVMLDRVPWLVATDKSRAGEVHDLTFDFDEPPHRSLCKLRRTLFAKVPDLRIIAINHTGRFLVSATQPTEDGQHQAGATAAPHERRDFLFCDGTAGTARFLPMPPVALRRANVGLFANGADHHAVAALHHTEGAADASVYFCEPRIGDKWDEITVSYPPGPGHRPWNTTEVICNGCSIYWVDPALGILCYDPLGDIDNLLYVPHPPGSQGSRHVQLSKQRVRLVQLEGANEATVIKVWTLSDTAGGQFNWKPGYEIPVSQLTDDQFRTKLTAEVPRIVCMHPNRPSIIYLSLERFIFEVDLKSGGTVAHHRMSNYAEDRVPLIVNFNSMPWTVVPALPRLLTATSRFRAIMESTGTAPSPSLLNFDLGLKDPYHLNCCYIAAVDNKSGTLLIFEEHGRRTRTKKHKNPLAFSRHIILRSDGTTEHLPVLKGLTDWHHNNAGIITNAVTGDTFVGLLNISHSFMNFWTSDCPSAWKRVSVSNASIRDGYTWIGHGAHALEGAIYWFDLRMGFLTCNPFTKRKNELKYISLPKESVLPESTRGTLYGSRCVNASFGSIRFIQMGSENGFPFLKLWTYAQCAPQWNLEYTVQLSNLDTKIAFPGFAHPWDLSRIYVLGKNANAVDSDGYNAYAVDSDGNIHEQLEFNMPSSPKECRGSLVHLYTLPVRSLHHIPAYPALPEV